MIKQAIAKLANFNDLSHKEAYEAMKEIMSKKATEAQIGSFLTALKMKGEKVEEIVGFAKAMLQFCNKINLKVSMLVDTCGTGGDSFKTINISTITSFVVAGANVKVAKHGNRAVTGKCGSADVLEKLGYNLNLNPERVKEMIERVGIGFIFAPKFHPAMKEVAGVRKEIGVRTVFNILGPLTNPANPNIQLIGVYSEKLVDKIARVLSQLGKKGVVVYGNGIDEVNISSENKVAVVRDGEIKLTKILPKDFGIDKGNLEELKALDVKENAVTLFKILYELDKSSRLKAVLANSALVLHLALRTSNLKEAVSIAEASIKDGKAYEKLKEMIKFSNGDLSFLEELEKKYG